MLFLGGILLAVFVLPSPWGIVAVFTGGLLDQVRVAGELWAARSSAGADPGAEVVVRGVKGLTLLVE